ncbi:uncharacterized protein LOC106881244 [Octopus bimaculoides]|uniref:Uncharacterized protein n=1 Tax=Octopus bimaculoides TaxID=37653 RepID=A0A0L8FUB8_OCTBM|nr:uncharacterized protein LOC106881244 [Octopus bimaculoides]|eukprot:XP_014787042.1 PREDICTED: uncharacterized protein DDB_G0292186-like [Octopus bimaculoides]
MEKKSKMHDKLPRGSNKEFYGIPPPVPERNQEYDMQFLGNSLDDDGYENYHRTSTLKVSNRLSVNSGMTSAQSSKNNELTGGVNAYSKMVTQNNGDEIDKDNANDQRKSDGKAVDLGGSTLYNDIANHKASTKNIIADCSFEDENRTYDDIRENFSWLSTASSEQISAPNPKQSSTTALQQNSKPTQLIKSISSSTSVHRNNSTPLLVKMSSKPIKKCSSITDKNQGPMTLPQNDSSLTSQNRRPSLPAANRPPMPIPQPQSSSATLSRSGSLSKLSSSTKTATAEQINSPKLLSPTKLMIANRPPLPIPQSTTPTTSPASPTTKTETAPQHKPKGSPKNSIIHASVKELCMQLESCGLHRVKDICQENCLDGYFVTKLPESSLQEAPFNLSSIEMMKLKMMLEGWRPKLE